MVRKGDSIGTCSCRLLGSQAQDALDNHKEVTFSRPKTNGTACPRDARYVACAVVDLLSCVGAHYT